MNRLIIIGASGHGRVVAEIAKKNGYEEIVFLDANETIKSCSGYPVVGSDTMAAELEGDLFIAIGNGESRKRLMRNNENRFFPVLIHPSAVIADDVQIGGGTVVMAGAVVNTGTKIGRGCIVNTSSSIDHDCVLGDYVHVSIGAHLCGTVTVKEETWIGAGAIVSNNLDLCRNCTIGAGTVVVRNIETPGTYIGVPARIKE